MAWQTPKTDWKAGDIPAATDFNRIEGNAEQLKQDVDDHVDDDQTHGVSGSYYLAKTSRSDQLPAWNDIQGKPSSYTPSSHNHDDRYYTESEADNKFEPKLSANRKRQIFVQSGTPSGANTGDLWIW